MAGMIRGSARAIRLPALAPVLAHRPAPEVADQAELRIQADPLGLQLRKRWLGHGHSASGCNCYNQTPIITSPDVGPLRMCRTPPPYPSVPRLSVAGHTLATQQVSAG